MLPDPAPAPSALRRLFLAAGYRVEEIPVGVLAARASDHRAVLLVFGLRSPAEVGTVFPADCIHRTLVYAQEPGDGARGLASQQGIEVLSPSTLGPALGELLLPSALLPGAGGQAARDDEPLESPFPPVATGTPTVRPRIDRREAQALAGLPGARYTLRLVPYFVAVYRVRVLTPAGLPGAVHRRLVAVNATTRRAEIWVEGGRELVTGVDGPAERLAPQLSEPGAVPIAVEAIRRFHTVRVDHTEQHAGAIVVESRRVAPGAEDVRLGPFSLIFVPFWYAETTEGRRVLDAVSGKGTPEPEPIPR